MRHDVVLLLADERLGNGSVFERFLDGEPPSCSSRARSSFCSSEATRRASNASDDAIRHSRLRGFSVRSSTEIVSRVVRAPFGACSQLNTGITYVGSTKLFTIHAVCGTGQLRSGTVHDAGNVAVGRKAGTPICMMSDPASLVRQEKG